MKKSVYVAAMALGLAVFLLGPAVGEEASVQLGEDGKLEYIPDEQGNKIPDFSRCGYMGGGVKIPNVAVKRTLEPRPGMQRQMQYYSAEAAGEGDDTERIQRAIDQVSAMPVDEHGFRGAVLLKRGLYRVSRPLNIRTSGVVLRGEGQFQDGTILLRTWSEGGALTVIEVGEPARRQLTEIEGSRRKISDSYVPWGAESFNLESTDGLSVGDKVIVLRPWTERWAEDVGMGGKWSHEDEIAGLNFRFQREIAAIDGNRITLDAPTVQPMEDKYGGGFVYRYEEEGALHQVGVEHLRLVASKDGVGNTSGVALRGCVNAWVRNINAVHFGYAGVQLSYREADGKHRLYGSGREFGPGCKFVTVQDCAVFEVAQGAAMGFPTTMGSIACFSGFTPKGGTPCRSVPGRKALTCISIVSAPATSARITAGRWAVSMTIPRATTSFLTGAGLEHTDGPVRRSSSTIPPEAGQATHRNPRRHATTRLATPIRPETGKA